MKKIIGFLIMLLSCINMALAKPSIGFKAMDTAPLPVTCVTGAFTKSGTGSWVQYSLKITNNCGKNIDFQNSSITFNSNINLNTSFWGNFSPLSYPDNMLQITSQPSSLGYISSLSLHFPEQPWANTILRDKESFILTYGASGTHIPSDTKVYISGSPTVLTGDINVTNVTTKPTNVTQNYVVVNLILNGQKINTVQVPWGSNFVITNLQPAVYTLQPQPVADADQNIYEGTAVPPSVTVVADQKVNSTISYQKIVNAGTINVNTPVLPSAISDYSETPVVTFKRQDTGATVTKTMPWNATTAVSDLANNVTYQVSTPTITYQGITCIGTFSPSSLMSSVDNPLTTQLSYACSSVSQVKVNISVSGLPCETRTITISFQPADGSSRIDKVINITRGSGTDSIMLTDGVVYNVSSTNIAGYSPSFNPQPVMAKPDVTETITYIPVPLK